MLSPNDKIQNLLFLRCMQVCKINHIHHTHYSWGHFSSPSHLTYCHYFASAVITVFLSVLPSVQDIFRHIFLSNYWWQKSDIWSQASYRYPISWEAFLDPSDSYFLFAEERGYHKWALAHSSSCCHLFMLAYHISFFSFFINCMSELFQTWLKSYLDGFQHWLNQFCFQFGWNLSLCFLLTYRKSKMATSMG